jgi:hypothetical protein
MRGGPNGGVYHPRNLGLYSYAYNNPVVLRDPDGRWASISVNGKRVNIVIPIYFDDNTNTAANKSNVNAQISTWTSQIERTWSGNFGGYDVKTTVQRVSVEDSKKHPEGLNYVSIIDPVPGVENRGSSNGWEVSEFRVTTASHEGQAALALGANETTAPHEVGHLLGLGDNEFRLKTMGDPFNIMTQRNDKGQFRSENAKPYKSQIMRIIKEHGSPPPPPPRKR